jgi:hemerythrin-like metal-binding protein
MTLMVWSDNLTTGIDIVDQQHRGLVDLINEAGPLLARSSHEHLQDIGPLLQRLLDYAAVHFQTEEGLMASHGVHPRVLQHHQQTHAGFVQKVQEMVSSFSSCKGVTGSELLSFLASWLVLHILGEDQAMARQLRARENGLDAERAYVEAAGALLDPSPSALSQSFSELYATLTRQNLELDDSRQKIEQHNRQLEQLVHERTLELERSRDAAQAANVAKSRFLGTMSHELRTPMNAIVGYSSLLRDDNLNTSQKTLAGKIVDSSLHLLDMINNVVEYARLDAGQPDDQTGEIFKLNTLLEEACHEAFASARAKDLAATLEIDPALPAMLRGDRRHLAFILGQFASNASKFTERGRIRVRANALGRDEKDAIKLHFDVEDTGIGIAPEDQTRLFAAFDQLDDRPNRRYEGIGLGLAMARQLAHLMGGEVGVESHPGTGSRFWLELSLQESVAHVESESSDPNPAAVSTPPTATRNPKAPITATLKLLEKLLANDDTRASEVFAKTGPHLRQTLGDRIDVLSQQINGFEYDRALQSLRAMIADQAGFSEDNQ